jgi:hypothetical protein
MASEPGSTTTYTCAPLSIACRQAKKASVDLAVSDVVGRTESSDVCLRTLLGAPENSACTCLCTPVHVQALHVNTRKQLEQTRCRVRHGEKEHSFAGIARQHTETSGADTVQGQTWWGRKIPLQALHVNTQKQLEQIWCRVRHGEKEHSFARTACQLKRGSALQWLSCVRCG